MIKVYKPRTVILLSEKEDSVTYHHVGGLDSGMCFLTDKNGTMVYAGSTDFEIMVQKNDQP